MDATIFQGASGTVIGLVFGVVSSIAVVWGAILIAEYIKHRRKAREAHLTWSPTKAPIIASYTDPVTNITIYSVPGPELLSEKGFDVAKLREPTEAIQAVRLAMQKYPQGFLRDNLKTVYLVERLVKTKQRERLGGLAVHTGNYVVISTKKAPRATETVFHHEFAHLVMHRSKDRFPYDEWKAINPPDFAYRAQRKLTGARGKPPDGFLTLHSTTNLNEDFADVAAHVFSNGTKNSSKQTDRLSIKCQLAVTFYGLLEPTFTWEFFATLAGRTRSERRKGARQSLTEA